MNGNITLNGTTENSKAKAECDSGYTLMGSEERICQRNGKWSGPPALCVIGKCKYHGNFSVMTR